MSQPHFHSRSVGAGLLCLAAAACNGGSPAQPTAGPPSDATVGDGGPDAPADGGAVTIVAPPDATAPVVYGLCPDAMAPTFPSILAQMFATASCGAGSLYDCHSTTGALPRIEGGTGNLLDFSLDAATIYAELIGDGSGYPAVNIEGEAGGLPRIAPGDADGSLLYIKLAMPGASDRRYGLAMPPNTLPCPAVLDTVRAWIEDGAAPR